MLSGDLGDPGRGRSRRGAPPVARPSLRAGHVTWSSGSLPQRPPAAAGSEAGRQQPEPEPEAGGEGHRPRGLRQSFPKSRAHSARAAPAGGGDASGAGPLDPPIGPPGWGVRGGGGGGLGLRLRDPPPATRRPRRQERSRLPGAGLGGWWREGERGARRGGPRGGTSWLRREKGGRREGGRQAGPARGCNYNRLEVRGAGPDTIDCPPTSRGDGTPAPSRLGTWVGGRGRATSAPREAGQEVRSLGRGPHPEMWLQRPPNPPPSAPGLCPPAAAALRVASTGWGHLPRGIWGAQRPSGGVEGKEGV